MSILIAGVLAM